jgi:hypothetical protein
VCASKVCRYLRGLRNGHITLYAQSTLVTCLREAAASPYPPGPSYCRSELAARLLNVHVLLRRRQRSVCCICSRVCKAAMSAAEADLAEVEDELADLYMLFSTGSCAQVGWCSRYTERVVHALTSSPAPSAFAEAQPQSLGVAFSLIVLAAWFACTRHPCLKWACPPAETSEFISCWLQGLVQSAEGWCHKTYAYNASTGPTLDLWHGVGTSHCNVFCQGRCSLASRFTTVMTRRSCQYVLCANINRQACHWHMWASDTSFLQTMTHSSTMLYLPSKIQGMAQC